MQMEREWTRKLVPCVIVFLLAAQASSTEYFVAPTGDDSSLGTQEAPFRTLRRAVDVLKAGDICYLRQGTYRETLRPEHSGEHGLPIVFAAYGEERVVISGADVVDGWQCHAGSIYKSSANLTLGSGNQLLVNGQMVHAARYPNLTSDDLFEPVLANMTVGDATGIQDTGLGGHPADYWRGGYAWVKGAWTTESASISSSLGDRVVLAKSLRAAAPRKGAGYFISHVFGELDQEGEWFFDGEMLYLWPPASVPPHSCVVEVKTRELGIDLRSREHVVVSGIELFACTATFENADHCTVEDISARYVSHDLQLQRGYSASKSGILLLGSHNTLRNSEIRFSSGNLVYVGGDHNQLINCLLTDANYLGSYDAAIKLGGKRNLVSHNTAKRCGRDVLSNFALSRGPDMSECVIQYNDFSESNLLSGDGGCLYIVHEDGNGTRIHHNRFYDSTERGIYMDNNCSNFIIDHNTIWNCDHIDFTLNVPSNFIAAFGNMVEGDFESTYAHMYENDTYGNHVFDNVFTTGMRTSGPMRSRDNQTSGFDLSANGPAGFQRTARPESDLELDGSFQRNKVFNASFDPQLGLEGWTAVGDRNLVKAFARTTDPMSDAAGPTRTTYGSLRLAEGQCGVQQRLTNLRPNTTYELSAWGKNPNDHSLRVSVGGFGDAEVAATIPKTGNYPKYVWWRHATVQFTTGPNSANAEIRLLRTGGDRECYFDDIGVIEVIVD